jgi:hypothetical protein
MAEREQKTSVGRELSGKGDGASLTRFTIGGNQFRELTYTAGVKAGKHGGERAIAADIPVRGVTSDEKEEAVKKVSVRMSRGSFVREGIRRKQFRKMTSGHPDHRG